MRNYRNPNPLIPWLPDWKKTAERSSVLIGWASEINLILIKKGSNIGKGIGCLLSLPKIRR